MQRDERLKGVSDQLKGVSTNFQTSQIQLEQESMEKLKRIAVLEADTDSQVRRLHEAELQLQGLR